MHSVSLQIENVTKDYPGVRALDQVSLSFHGGEVHGLIGANGAGKSTLIKILSGAIQPDSGDVWLENRSILPLDPSKAKAEGIQVIYQELNLVPRLSVAENIFLGHEINTRMGLVNTREMIDEAQKLLDDLGVPIDPSEEVGNLTVSYQQMVAVAGALLQEAKVLIIDEATAALTGEETEHLFQWIQNLKAKGLAVVYVSHRIDEIFTICDRVSVLLDGKYVGTVDTDQTQRKDLISMMVGDEFIEQLPPSEGEIGDVLLSVRDIKLQEGADEISFDVRRGEIVGIFGLVGSGRTEIARALFGAERFQSGEIELNGEKAEIRIPADAVEQGIVLMPEDRKEQGLLLRMSVLENISMPSVKNLSNAGVINGKAARKVANSQINDLRIVTPSADQEVQFLSGGNQQKVVLAKWLATESELLILDQPTRGIDVRAKSEIYQIMRDLAAMGHGLIMISDELSEILGMSDRIIVMHEGRITGILPREDADREKILHLAYGEEERGGII